MENLNIEEYTKDDEEDNEDINLLPVLTYIVKWENMLRTDQYIKIGHTHRKPDETNEQAVEDRCYESKGVVNPHAHHIILMIIEGNREKELQNYCTGHGFLIEGENFMSDCLSILYEYLGESQSISSDGNWRIFRNITKTEAMSIIKSDDITVDNIVMALSAFIPEVSTSTANDIGLMARNAKFRLNINSKDYDRRFDIMIGSCGRDLIRNILYFIKIASRAGIKFNAEQLREDVNNWNNIKRDVQQRWTQSFIYGHQ